MIASLLLLIQLASLDGIWSGRLHSERDHSDVTIEIKSAQDGSLQATYYQPLVNFFNLPVTVRREADQAIRLVELESTLTLRDGRLEGVMPGFEKPLVLTRASKVPVEAPVPDFPKGPSPSWQARLGGMIHAPVTVQSGVAYIGTTSGIMNAVGVEEGKHKWTFNAGRPIHGAALVTGDAVYFVCDNGMLYRLDAAKGKEVWRYDLGDALVPRLLPHPYVYDWDSKSPQPVLGGDTIYAGSGDGSFHAVKASDGKRVWRFAGKSKIRSDAAIAGDKVIFGALDGLLYALDRQSGKEVWRVDTKGAITGNPVLIDGKIVVGTRGSVVAAIDPADGSVLWKNPFWGSWVDSNPVPYGGHFYIGSSDLRRVTCYDNQGRLVWRTDVYGWTWGSPLVTEKRVYAGVAGGGPYFIRHLPSLTALDRATGKIVWRWVPPESPAFQSGFAAGPAIEGNKLIIGAMDGTLYAFPLP